MRGTREHRVTLAVKWRYLDHLRPQEIVERFQEEGYNITSVSTVNDYLSESPKEEVLEQIEKQHVDTRLQIAEREEHLYQRAREDEQRAVQDVPIKRVIPQTGRVREKDAPMEYPRWEFVEPGDDDWPVWADDDDTIIRFLDETVLLEAGEPFPARGLDGKPKYTSEFAGLERDQPHLQGRQAARYEQSAHLENKGEVLGIYEETINLDADVETSLDDDDKNELLDAISKLRGGDDS